MGGVIYADKWLSAFRVGFHSFSMFFNHHIQDQFKKMGGVIHDREAVLTHSENANNTLSVLTSKSRYTTKKIILTVGSWITKFLPDVKFNIEVYIWSLRKNIFIFSRSAFPSATGKRKMMLIVIFSTKTIIRCLLRKRWIWKSSTTHFRIQISQELLRFVDAKKNRE